MKTRIFGLVAGIMFGSIVMVNGQTNQPAHEKFFKGNWSFYGASTNGLACMLRIERGWQFLNGQHPPVCLVHVANQTTNHFCWLTMPATNLFGIELFDAKGKSVEKTSLGKMYGLPLSQKQISDWFNDSHWQIIRHGRSFDVYPLEEYQIRSFSIPEAFEIKEAGEYTLHVRIRLIGNGPDASGQFSITWLPEVVAKVQIRPEDIKKANQ